MGVAHYWLDDPTVPFGTLLTIASNYCNPEDPDAYDSLLRQARNRPDHEKIQRLKAEMRSVLEGDTEGLHPDALFSAASYSDGSDVEFLRRLWTDLFPQEPMPGT